jgi:hypothetical protein
MVVGRAAGGSGTTLTFDYDGGLVASDLHADDFARTDRFNGLLLMTQGRTARVTDSAEAATVVTLTFAASSFPVDPAVGDHFSLQADLPRIVTYIMIYNQSGVGMRYTEVDERGLVTGAAAGAVGQYTELANGVADLVIDAEHGSRAPALRVTSLGVGGEIIELRVKA